eukprot:NODE_204_length_14945_cov_0.251313.p10 type:complete len:167 gc:universal NODE_204_length_14945_cov_0.251313:12650-12150(-)
MIYGINGCNPKFVKSKEITSRYNINSLTLRNWSKYGTIRCLSMPEKEYLHNLFQEPLKFKCKQRGRTMVECTDAFTSQTCTRCGTLKKTNLQSYACTKFYLEIDRDHMAARNIYIKYIYTYSIPPKGSASVSNHCNGESSTASFSVENSRFSRKSGLLMSFAVWNR